MIKTMFGYRVENGLPVIDCEQAEILRRTVDRYIGGASLKSEAERMTAEKVEYAPGKTDWNKNRVQRMLTNRTCLGDEYHAPILEEPIFEKVQRIMQSRNTQKDCQRNRIFSPSVIPIFCGACGGPVVRKHDMRWKVPTHYLCRCGKSCAIPDAELYGRVKAVLKTVGKKRSRRTGRNCWNCTD